MKKWIALIALSFAFVNALAACSGKDDDSAAEATEE